MPENKNQFLASFLAAPQRPEGTLTFHKLQGFLFAMACAPELIKPSEWLPLIFNEQEAEFADEEEGQAVYQAIIDLYNEVNLQVLSGEASLPEDVAIVQPALDNIGEAGLLGQWSMGLFMGHDWLIELWREYTPEALDEELGSCLMVLSFFADRKLAEAYHQELGETVDTLESHAAKLLGLFEPAMQSYAHLGRSIYETLLEQSGAPRSPYVAEPKVGRNDPCPCGSGKKYKKCCLH